MNRKVAERNGFSINQYGCCGEFFFFIANEKGQIIKRSLPTLSKANEFIDEQIENKDISYH